MQKITALFIAIIQLLLLIDNTKQSRFKQAVTTFKTIGNNIIKPRMKEISKTLQTVGIKDLSGTVKNSISKSQGFYLGLKKESQKYLGMNHNNGKSTGWMNGKNFRSLVNMKLIKRIGTVLIAGGMADQDQRKLLIKIPWPFGKKESELKEEFPEKKQNLEELKKVMTVEQYHGYRILHPKEHEGEPEDMCEWNNTFDPGMYNCRKCKSPLFKSDHKYDVGWGVTFWGCIKENVLIIKDIDDGSLRWELGCKNCKAYLGHRHDDGPEDKGGKRFMVNSSTLDFIPKINNP